MIEFLRDRFFIASPSILLLVIGIRQGHAFVVCFAITWIVFWLMGVFENSRPLKPAEHTFEENAYDPWANLDSESEATRTEENDRS